MVASLNRTLRRRRVLVVCSLLAPPLLWPGVCDEQALEALEGGVSGGEGMAEYCMELSELSALLSL